jgi:hypothetical protein
MLRLLPQSGQGGLLHAGTPTSDIWLTGRWLRADYSTGSLDVRHLLDVIIYDVRWKPSSQSRPTAQRFKVAPSGLHGRALIMNIAGRSRTSMNWIFFSTRSVEVIDFPLKLICGGHMPHISPILPRLIRRLISSADRLMRTSRHYAMRQLLDAYQAKPPHSEPITASVVFFTQLMDCIWYPAGELGLARIGECSKSLARSVWKFRNHR